jgi:hypothetical protein
MLGCCNLPAMDYLAAAIYFQDSERTEWLRILLVKAGLPE